MERASRFFQLLYEFIDPGFICADRLLIDRLRLDVRLAYDFSDVRL